MARNEIMLRMLIPVQEKKRSVVMFATSAKTENHNLIQLRELQWQGKMMRAEKECKNWHELNVCSNEATQLSAF